MSFEIKIKKKALKFVSGLQKGERERLRRVLPVLKEDPIPIKALDVAKLKGERNLYRIRLGKIRVVYEVMWEEKVILIHRVNFREKVYRGV